ncbi:MAG: PAS domain S-box protein, partial [Desulfosudaceae bacterium]
MAAKLTYEQLEQQLRALQKKWNETGDIEYAHILNTSIDGFWILDSQGRVLESNPAAARMLGYRQRELMGMAINDIDAEENPDQTRQRLARLSESGYDRFETRHRRKDGGLIDVEISARYLPEKNGR